MAKNDPCSKCGKPSTDSYLRHGLCHNCDQRRRHRIGYECSYIAAAQARAHVAELQAVGMGMRQIAKAAGIDRKLIQCLMTGRADRGTGPSERVARKTHDRLLAVEVPEPLATAIANGQRVDAIGTIRRLQALVAYGYTRTYLAQRIGWSIANIGRLMDPATGKVNADTARKVAALFDELQLTPGNNVRARNEGNRRGWPLPMDWDEDNIDVIDDGEEPDTEPEKLDFTARYLEMHDDLGMFDTEIADRMGIKIESLQRQIDRHGLREVAA